MTRIAWEMAPEPDSSRGIRVVTIKPGCKQIFRLIDSIVGVWLHWVDNRKRPCAGESCPHCELYVPRRWYGYAPALQEIPGKAPAKVVVEITENINFQLDGLEQKGLVIFLSRSSKFSPLRLEIPKNQSDKPLPESFDVRPILLKMWGLK